MLVFTIAISKLYFVLESELYIDRMYYNLIKKCETCDGAKRSAQNDFERGIYQIVQWGMGDSKTSDVTAEVLETKYKIKTARGGCVTNRTIECYDTEMRKLLAKKYDDKIYLSAYREAAQRVYQEDLARYIYQEKYRKRPRPQP
ncbi:hypothetical protein [Hymenobacter crusticola]|uniref:hypothetical protein n=1 Tax=Hymenobacter crusticola TaxID=1770526 RepID=UPI001C4FD276|nr:hypothetical protein [Hymenobacter crusticola]